MFISFDNILLMWLSRQPELQNKMGALWMGGFDESAKDSLEVFRHAVGLFACPQVCEQERERRK